jgi:hypothetical protein
MKSTYLTAFALIGIGAAAFAMSDAATALDANADGLLTVDEVQAGLPDVTPEGFAAMDANGDGALDSDEVTAAEASGLMPTGG